MPLTLGTTLGHYQVTALIGEGGMVRCIEREAKVLASLNHTNVGHIYRLSVVSAVAADDSIRQETAARNSTCEDST